MNRKYKNLIKDTFIFAFGSLGSKFLLFILVPLYTNYMTAAEYGTADLVFTLSQFLIPFFSVVVFDAVIRFGLSKDENPGDVLKVGFAILTIASIVSIATTPLLGFYKPISDWKWYLCAYVIFNIANSIELNYLKVKNKNKMYSLLCVLQTTVMAILNIYFLKYAHLGVKGYLLAYIISNIAIDILAFVMGRMGDDLVHSKFDKDLFKRMVLYSSPLILNNVSWWVIHSSDKVMVEAMVGATALGIYTVSAKIPSLLNVFVTIFQQAWGISSVKEIESSNDTQFYSSVFRMYNLITSGACIFFVAVMKLFMRYYVGSGFTDAWKYVPLLLVSAVFAAVAGFYGSLYGALKKSVNNMITTAVAAITNIIVNFCFIPLVGIWGAVIGTLVSYIVIAFARMIDVGKYIHIQIDWKKYAFNSCVILSQAILVSVDFHIYLVSGIALFTFCVVNGKDLLSLLRKNKRGDE